MKAKPDDPASVQLMRPHLLRLLADAGQDTQVLEYAESLGSSYRRDPASVPASLVETGLVVGAYRGDRALFSDYQKRFESTTVPIERTLYLNGLAAFRNPDLRKMALEYALTGPLRPQEVLVIPAASSTNGLGTEARSGLAYPDEIADWMFEHFGELRAKLPPNFATRIMNLGVGCSESRLAEMREYFGDPKNHVVGGANLLKRMADTMQECADLHERESERVERWLQQRAAQP
jgi:hypothetical protein